MIELAIVRRIIRRGLLLTPVAVIALWGYGGTRYAVSTAVGIAIALLNLWVAGRIIGGVAENRPSALLLGGAATFIFGLLFITAASAVLYQVEYFVFAVGGLSLIGAHLVVAVWEAADAFLRIEPKPRIEGPRS